MCVCVSSRGHYAEVMLPYYTCIPDEVIQNKRHECEFLVPKGYHWDGEMRLGTQKTHVYSGIPPPPPPGAPPLSPSGRSSSTMLRRPSF